MPYKNPEDKRRWERDHREQRNAQRKKRFAAPMKTILPKPAPDPVSDQQPNSGWKEIIGLAVGFGIVLLAALGGAATPGPDSLGPSSSPRR